MRKYVEVSFSGSYTFPLDRICNDLAIRESDISDIAIIVKDGSWDKTLHIELKDRSGQIGNEIEYRVECLRDKPIQRNVKITDRRRSDHPIYNVLKQIVSMHEIVCETFERMDSGDLFQYVQDQLEEHYESDPESFLQDALDFSLLKVNNDLDQASEEDYLSPDQLKAFGERHGVEFSPEDARDPLVIQIWQMGK